MKTIVLCGGTGTRMKEETEFKPKPLVLVGGKPILWHIMKIYAHYGFNDFILALGYKGDMIKQYFLNWRNYTNDFSINTKTHDITFHNNDVDDFKITFAETGQESLTGERVRRVAKYIGSEDFMVTYGDGLADIDVAQLVEFHKKQGTIGTTTAVKPTSRFGLLQYDEATKKMKGFFQHKVTKGAEAQYNDLINGGFMVFKNEALNYLKEGSMVESIFEPLCEKGEMSIFEHVGKWKCMDTYKEVEEMNTLWAHDPFWKVW